LPVLLSQLLVVGVRVLVAKFHEPAAHVTDDAANCAIDIMPSFYVPLLKHQFTHPRLQITNAFL
jgi:hypothetical protein